MPFDDTKLMILVVEDDTLIRMLSVVMLEEAGFAVFEAANADDAVTILDANDDVRLLFSDIEMPGSMDGVDLARLVHERWPSIRLLLTSGRQHLDDAALPDGGKFVRKPYKPDVMVRTVQALLGA